MGGWGHSFPNKNHKYWTNEISPVVFPNLTKTLGWVNTFGTDLPKTTFFYSFPSQPSSCRSIDLPEMPVEEAACLRFD